MFAVDPPGLTLIVTVKMFYEKNLSEVHKNRHLILYPKIYDKRLL